MLKATLNLHITEYEWIGDKSHPVVQAVRLLVPKKINELVLDGVSVADLSQARDCEELAEIGQLLGEQGDRLLFPNKKNLKDAENLLDGLVHAISTLAFIPGGIQVFGVRYEVIQNGEKS